MGWFVVTGVADKREWFGEVGRGWSLEGAVEGRRRVEGMFAERKVEVALVIIIHCKT